MKTNLEINEPDFEMEILKSKQPVLVNFWADWSQLIKIPRWRSVRFSPVIRRGPRNPVFNDFDENAFGKRTRPARTVLVPSEHSGLPLGPTGCPLPAARACASQHRASVTLASAPTLERNSYYVH
jgi:hypothetical protein